MCRLLETLLGDEDRAVLTGAFAEYMLETDGTGSLPESTAGWTTTWPSRAGGASRSPRSQRPVLLLHGEDDRFVPVSHGQWLAERIPGVEARIDRTTAI